MYAKSGYRKGYSSSYRRSRFGARRFGAFSLSTKRVARTRYVTRVNGGEKKYADQSWITYDWLPQIISYETVPGTPSSSVTQGMKFMSMIRQATVASSAVGSANNSNLVAWVAQGSTATSRVGNKVEGRWIDVGVTVEAAQSPVEQGGEQVNPEGAVTTPHYYMKTNYRIVIVKDLQVNNTTGNVTWADVFGGGSNGTEGTYFGSSDKLDIPNMGRFRVLSDVRCTLDGDTPLKNLRMFVRNIGSIRYNAGTSPSLTDKGYYVVIAQDVVGGASTTNFVIPGKVRIGTRFCFTDA